ncbi:hypothetical protein RhiirA4_464328 [Rhizophagus irregularis]|uniref:Uncharacterized protein n=1 Tax=Rhizophagus irregularis TaxID=588596 RepID=A0A2I1GPV2_9GLOM|nr:hypothetical protein RhiirA4_464328 [Rhizophagus irregularis]
MITYWKSNAKKKFGFFNQEKVIEILAETDNAKKEEDNEYEDNLFDKSKLCIEKPIQKTINDKIIPNNNDLDDNFIDNERNNNENIILTNNETVDDTNSRDILNYNVNT